MPVQLQSTQGYGANLGVKILVYSRAGRGKTTLCATCPTPVIFSAESGLLALARYNLPYTKIENLAQLREAYLWARGSAEANQFETICLDSISEIAENILGEKLTPVGNKLVDGRQAYGQMIQDVEKVVRNFRDLPGKHVYMSAKQERIKDEQSGIIINGPMMPGNKLGQAMPYFPDEVFQLDVNDNPYYHFLRCRPDFQNDAKDRSGVLDPVEEPHLGKIINKIISAPMLHSSQ